MRRICTPDRHVLKAGIALFGAMALLGSASAAGAQQVPLSVCAPGQSFTPTVTNTFFPLPLDQQWVVVGRVNKQGDAVQITVGGTAPFYNGTVTTRVVEEFEWADTDLDGIFQPTEAQIERSFNYFAQTQAGTVCYFGEASNTLSPNGTVISTEGSWRADSPGNAPGIFMPVNPTVGTSFQQEDAPGVAMDEATVIGSGTVKVPAGTFTDTLRVQEFNPIEGGKFDYKTYARDVGTLTDDTLELVRCAFDCFPG